MAGKLMSHRTAEIIPLPSSAHARGAIRHSAEQRRTGSLAKDGAMRVTDLEHDLIECFRATQHAGKVAIYELVLSLRKAIPRTDGNGEARS